MPLSIVPTPYRLCGALRLTLAKNPKSELKETIRFTLAKAIVDFTSLAFLPELREQCLYRK
jgi:hypothetical protein